MPEACYTMPTHEKLWIMQQSLATRLTTAATATLGSRVVAPQKAVVRPAHKCHNSNMCITTQ
jgi:hypothetical protein